MAVALQENYFWGLCTANDKSNDNDVVGRELTTSSSLLFAPLLLELNKLPRLFVSAGIISLRYDTVYRTYKQYTGRT